VRRFLGLLLSIFASVTLAAPARGQQVVSEDSVKAAFLYRFASFVDWPAEVFLVPETPINLCLVGAAAMRPLLERAVADQRIAGRGFTVQTHADARSLDGCHIVYVRGGQTEAVLEALRRRPVLTVTDGASDRLRGVIHFVSVDNRIRFHIDDALAAESRLTVSSRLLALAVSVRRRT
jgi:hypothetical protein